MKRYEVEVQEKVITFNRCFVQVDAENEEQAREKALDSVAAGEKDRGWEPVDYWEPFGEFTVEYVGEIL